MPILRPGRRSRPSRRAGGEGHRPPVERGQEVVLRDPRHVRAGVCVAEPTCGRRSRFGACRIGSPGDGGSGSATSSAAAPIRPRRSASTSAAWSTIAARAVLTRIAERFMRLSAWSSMRWRVRGVSGQWSETTSERASSSSIGTPPDRLVWRTVIPNPRARSATARPMRPSPTTPSVAPRSSSPRKPAGSHVRQAPVRTASTPSGNRRAAPRSRAQVRVSSPWAEWVRAASSSRAGGRASGHTSTSWAAPSRSSAPSERRRVTKIRATSTFSPTRERLGDPARVLYNRRSTPRGGAVW